MEVIADINGPDFMVSSWSNRHTELVEKTEDLRNGWHRSMCGIQHEEQAADMCDLEGLMLVLADFNTSCAMLGDGSHWGYCNLRKFQRQIAEPVS